MSFEISCHLRFLRLFQLTIEWFRKIRPISGMGWMGWMDGRLSPFDGLLRAPTVLITRQRRMWHWDWDWSPESSMLNQNMLTEK